MTVHDLTGTISGGDDSLLEGEGEREVPRLIVAMECRRPFAGAMRIALTDLDEVVLGRGRERGVARSARRAEVSIGDQEMSRQHSRLRQLPGSWEISDLGSKNKTIVNGETCARASLVDGDLIEVGTTMLIFREDTQPDDCDDLDLSPATAGPAAFRTVQLAFERQARDLAKIAPSTVPVLIRGETGTGKELVARGIHELSGRRGAFVPINCGALPRTLVESELFGYRRGAFSGAKEDRDGLVRRADAGTLFLDEIAELPEESQVALLRVLQEGEVRPVGAGDVVRVDVRVVAATHQDLSARIANGKFREDLYARLAGFQTMLPPLRNRREDIGTVIAALLPRLGVDTSNVTFHRTAARALLRYDYPLNIRELEQALRAAVVLAEGKEVRLEHLPEAIRAQVALPASPLRPEDRALRERLIEILRDNQGNVAAAGRVMNKAPIQIRRWCRRFAIDPASFRQ